MDRDHQEIVCKILIWCIPAWLLVRCFDDGMKIKSGEFFSCKKGIVPFFLLMLLFTVYQLATSYWKHGQIALNPSMEMCYLVSSVTIGLSEEMVFRGWLLNATLKDKGQWIAVGINALLFLAIHFPFWIRSGLFTAYFTTGSFIQVLVLSCLFSWMFIKSRSILLPAILHAYWDLLCYIV